MEHDHLSAIVRKAADAELEIGQGIPSGPGGQWRILFITAPGPLRIWYGDGSSVEVHSWAGWCSAPEHGVQAVTGAGFIAKNADEYAWAGYSKYGEMINENEYRRIIMEAIRG